MKKMVKWHGENASEKLYKDPQGRLRVVSLIEFTAPSLVYVRKNTRRAYVVYEHTVHQETYLLG